MVNSQTRSDGPGSSIPSTHPDWMLDRRIIGHDPLDLTIVSSDLVHFHVHSHRLLANSSNNFNGRLSHPLSSHLDGHDFPTLKEAESGRILNVVLHVIYGTTEHIRSSQTTLSLTDILSVISTLQLYGISIRGVADPSSALFDAIVAHCPYSPLAVYIIGAKYNQDLHHIAKHASQYLLSLDLSSISDEAASDMGSVYLKRLVLLHTTRIREFKRIVSQSPPLHTPQQSCDSTPLARVWGLGSAYLAWIASADVEESVIDNIIGQLEAKLPCDACKAILREKGQRLTRDWAAVTVSILFAFFIETNGHEYKMLKLAFLENHFIT